MPPRSRGRGSRLGQPTRRGPGQGVRPDEAERGAAVANLRGEGYQVLVLVPGAAQDVVAAINNSDIAWFANIHPLTSDEECMEPFDNIENQTIERFYNNYLEMNKFEACILLLLEFYSNFLVKVYLGDQS